MSDYYGPALPPGFAASQSDDSEKDDTTKSLGPQPPTSLRAVSPTKTASASGGKVYGPVLPPVSDSARTDTSTHTYGPRPPGNDEMYVIPENETRHDDKQGEPVVVWTCILAYISNPHYNNMTNSLCTISDKYVVSVVN